MKYKFLISFFIVSLYSTAQNVTTFTYAVKGLDTLKLDVYSPEHIEQNVKLPVVIWMHGGGFSSGMRNNFATVSFMNYLTNKGYIGVSISYRLLRKGAKTGFGCDCPTQDKLFTFASAAKDFLDATSFIIANAEDLTIDLNKIIAGGSSAGAEAVLSALFMKAYYLENASLYDHIKFAGVLSLAGALVDVKYINESNAVPTVLFHGTEDKIVPFGIAAHHNCSEKRKGYLLLHGSQMISNRLDTLQTSYYLQKVIGGTHEISEIPFNHLDRVFEFFNRTVLNLELIQTKKTIFKD
jgi:acetyl esterase/lipase